MGKTKIAKVVQGGLPAETISEAAKIVREGGLVIIPTETVYGIAVDNANEKAVKRLKELKERPDDKPFSLHIAEKEKVEELAVKIPVYAYKIMDAFWPGPLTVVLNAKDGGTIGVRVPDDKIAIQIINEVGVPVACPSANISGSAAPKDFLSAIKDFEGKVDFAIDAGPTRLGVESTVVDLTGDKPNVLREGAVKKEDIDKAAAKKTVLFICTGNSCRSVMAEALLKKILKEKGRTDVEVSSAGITMLTGMGASEGAKNALRAEGIDVSGHVSKKITPWMLRKTDLILVMEKLHEESVLKMAPDAKIRLFLLKEFAKINEDGLDIRDPMGSSPDFYASVLSVIKEAVERVSKLI